MSGGCYTTNDIAVGLRTFGQPYISKGTGPTQPANNQFGNRNFAYNWNLDNAFNFRVPRENCYRRDAFENNFAADFSQVLTGPPQNNTMPSSCAAGTPSQYFDLHVKDPIIMRGSVPTDQVQNPRYIPSTVAKSLGIRGIAPNHHKMMNEARYWRTVNKAI